MNREQLVQGLSKGDSKTWETFVALFGPMMYAAIQRSGLSLPEQEEAFQESCLAIHGSIQNLQDPTKLASWAYGIAYRQAVTLWRKRQRRPEGASDELVELPELQTNTLDRLAQIQMIAIAMDGIETLDPRCRNLIGALYLEDPPMSYAAISEAWSIPFGSIGPSRARCLDKLRRYLEGLDGEISEGVEP